MHNVCIRQVVSVMVIMACSPDLHAAQVLFFSIGDLEGGGIGSWANGVTADGSMVVGRSSSAAFAWEAFVWENGVMTGLGAPAGMTSLPSGISADGSVIVGNATTASSLQVPLRWTNGVIEVLPLPEGGIEGSTIAVTPDALFITGFYKTSSILQQAIRWGPDGITLLGSLPGGSTSIAADISTDGSIIVGYGTSSELMIEAFRWENGTMTGLGTLPGFGGNYTSTSSAYGISDDGSTIVGVCVNIGVVQAFVWQSGVMKGLPNLTDTVPFSIARAVSADGSIIVGLSGIEGGSGAEAVIWDRTSNYGVISLADYLTSHGVDLDGFQLDGAAGVSGDGLKIVGSGTNKHGIQEGYLVIIPESGYIGLIIALCVFAGASVRSTRGLRWTE